MHFQFCLRDVYRDSCTSSIVQEVPKAHHKQYVSYEANRLSVLWSPVATVLFDVYLFVVSDTLGRIWSAIDNKEILIPLSQEAPFFWGNKFGRDYWLLLRSKPSALGLWVGVSYLLAKLVEKMYRPCLKRKFLSLCTGHPLPVVQFVPFRYAQF